MIRWYSAEDCIDEGALAFLEGRPVGDNPYIGGDLVTANKREWWARGWLRQQRWSQEGLTAPAEQA